MAKKKAKPRSQGQRIDLLELGIDLRAILDDKIRPNLTGTYAEIGERAGGMPAGAVSNVLNGHDPASLGAVAALAKASGGRIVVRYDPPKGK